MRIFAAPAPSPLEMRAAAPEMSSACLRSSMRVPRIRVCVRERILLVGACLCACGCVRGCIFACVHSSMHIRIKINAETTRHQRPVSRPSETNAWVRRARVRVSVHGFSRAWIPACVCVCVYLCADVRACAFSRVWSISHALRWQQARRPKGPRHG